MLPIICIELKIKRFVVRIKCKPSIARQAYIPIPQAWPIAHKIPAERLNLTLFLIINATLGPGDIAPITHTKTNCNQKVNDIQL